MFQAISNRFMVYIIFAGNMDLMAGMNTELRDENAEGKYALLSVHYHVIITRTRRLGQPRPRRTSFLA